MPSSPDAFSVADALILSVRDYPANTARIYIALGTSLARVAGITLHSGSHGFIAHELRGYRGAEWCYSLVLNKSWVRLYIRRPELAANGEGADAFRRLFQMSEITEKGEIALNIGDEGLARHLCVWLESQVGSP